MKIPYSKPSITKLEIEYVNDAVSNGWGDHCYDYIEKFQTEFAKYLGVKFCVATSSCTGALHLGLAALGIKTGDEVIVPNTTWIASVNPVLYLGATPIFVDISSKDWCLDPELIEEKITHKTRAIIVTHLYGNTAEVIRMKSIAEKYNLYLIEDAAEALGAKINGQPVGTFGHMAVFSFHGTKMVTTGEGGMVVTNDSEMHDRILQLNNHGRSASQHKQFWSESMGYKYKISNIQAALGLAQLHRIEHLIKRKREIFFEYLSRLSSLNIEMNKEKSNCIFSFWMPTIQFNQYGMNSSDLFKSLYDLGINARHVFWPVTQFPFIAKQVNTPISFNFSKKALNLPSFHDITEQEIDYITESIKSLIT